MECQEIFNLNNQIYGNNNNLLLDVIKRLQNLVENINDNILITKIKDIIIIINKVINNTEIQQSNNDTNQKLNN